MTEHIEKFGAALRRIQAGSVGEVMDKDIADTLRVVGLKLAEAPKPKRDPAGHFPQTWDTDETPSRMLTVCGRSGVDPDCLVAYLSGSKAPLWIIDQYGGEWHPVVHLDGVKARPRTAAALTKEG